MADTFIFRKEWIDNISTLDEKTQDKIISDLARYGVGVEMHYEDDPVVAAFVESQKKRIDGSIAAYEEKVVMSQGAGRKSSVDRSQIYELAYSGLSAKEIAAMIGCSPSTVHHSAEWKKARQALKEVEENPPVEVKKISVFDF